MNSPNEGNVYNSRCCYFSLQQIFETILKRKLIVLPNPRRTQLIHSTASTKASYFVLLYRPECSGLPVRKTQLINPTPPLTPITEAQHHDDLPPTNRHPLTLIHLRSDGRRPHEIRHMSCHLGALPSTTACGSALPTSACSGSALVSMGLTQVLCVVRGPSDAGRRTEELPDR